MENMMNPLLTGMNDKQAEAVQTTEGPLLIMAGAGSGKTRVLTHRIAYLIDEKMINPWNILAITFTNKAAREMRERAMALNPATSETLIATFHSMCVRILRREADHIGYNRNLTIVDPPRSGLSKKVINNLFRIFPKNIIYMSCNIITLVRDLKLLEDKYNISYIQPFNNFPRTYHVETVALLSKIDVDKHISVEIELDELDLTSAENTRN